MALYKKQIFREKRMKNVKGLKNVEAAAVSLSRGSCVLFLLATETCLANGREVRCCTENGSLTLKALCPDIISFHCLQ